MLVVAAAAVVVAIAAAVYTIKHVHDVARFMFLDKTSEIQEWIST